MEEAASSNELDVGDEDLVQMSKEVSLRFTIDRNQERQRYNLPTSSEVAVVVPEDEAQTTSSHDIVLRRTDGFLQRVDEGSTIYECLQYPLFFPYGENGYH